MSILGLILSIKGCSIKVSSLNNNGLGENSIIVFDPFLVFVSKGDRIKLIKGSHVEEYTEDVLCF